MEEEFVPYKESLELRKLGFDETCLAWFSDKNIRIVGVNGCALSSLPVNSTFSNGYGEFVTSPTWRAAFKWFRDKYGFVGNVLGDGFNGDLKGYYYSITEQGWINLYESIDSGKWYDTYEEAELECLRELINIVKNAE
jgi:hypothetical protein